MTRFEKFAAALGISAALATLDLIPILPPAWAVGTWRVQEIRGRPAIYRATLRIAADGAYSDDPGCNGAHGRVAFFGKSLRFSGPRTLRACGSRLLMEQEGRYERAIWSARRAQVDPSGQLLLFSDMGELLLRFSRIDDAPPPSPVTDQNGEHWRVEDIRGHGVVDDSLTTLRIGPDGVTSGSTGCNDFHGRATISGEKLRFRSIKTEGNACPRGLADQERHFLEALSDARVKSFDLLGQLQILSDKGEPLLTLGRFRN